MLPRTIDNNELSPSKLFDEIVGRVSDEMHERIFVSARDEQDSATRLSFGLRHFIKRTHEEPGWGRFALRFAFSSHTLQCTWSGQPAVDVTNGVATGRFAIAVEQIPSVLATISATTFCGMALVLNGQKAWREGGSDAAEFALRALGVVAAEAREIANLPLPLLLN